jgi:hypothetical protein
VVDDEIITACTACAGGNGALLSYRLVDDTWTLAQTVSPAEANRSGAGNIAALSDDVAVLISPFLGIGDYIGIPWVLERGADGQWGAPTRLIPSDPLFYPNCGAAIRGDTLVLGSCEFNDRRGGLMVFERADGVWEEATTLSVGEVPGTYPTGLSGFGESITFVGDDILVAGIRRLEREDGSGWLVAFARGEDGWHEIDGPRIDETGRPSIVGGILLGTDDRLAVGYNRTLDGEPAPEHTVFARRGDRWVLQGQVRHPVSRNFARAEALAAWGDRLVIGSPYTNTLGRDAGMVWIY